jgi:hypothetical protein
LIEGEKIMAVTMQGAWTVTVAAKHAAFAQRVVVSQAGHADIIVSGVVGHSVFVNAAQWSVNVQSQSAANQPWRDSAQRITSPAVSGGLLNFNINTDDSGGDKDYNDLVLTCSMPLSASEFVVYGKASTYSGRCLWNPCYPWYYAIESQAALTAALAIPDLSRIIAKLYPQRIPRRIPVPDPGPLFTPLLLPKAAPVPVSGLFFARQRPQRPCRPPRSRPQSTQAVSTRLPPPNWAAAPRRPTSTARPQRPASRC